MLLAMTASVLAAVGAALILGDVMRVPSYAASRAMNSLGKKQNRRTNPAEVYLRSFSNWLAGKLRMNAYRRRQLEIDLQCADRNESPEQYMANAMVKAALIGVFGIPVWFLSPVCSLLLTAVAVMVYFWELGKVGRQIKEKRKKIEYELPGLVLIRYKLIERGYSVGQLGTEPSSLLFGMDECIPFGYNNENELKGNQFVSCINQHIRRIAEKDVDIIISGCQSESLIRDFCNESALTIRQFEFLLGLQPDIIILSVNPFDDLHYIQRTISYLESVSDSEVLCLSLFPVDLKNRKLGIDSGKISLTQDSYEQLKSVYEGELGKPVFHMGNMDDIERMVDLIIDYFSK